MEENGKLEICELGAVWERDIDVPVRLGHCVSAAFHGGATSSPVQHLGV